MKYLFITIIVLFNTLEAKGNHSSIKVPYQQCLKYPYGHIIGGTMYSRLVQKRRLQEKAQSLTGYTTQEALITLQKVYPDLKLEGLKLVVKSCQVYFRVLSKSNIYYFDAGNLLLLEIKER